MKYKCSREKKKKNVLSGIERDIQYSHPQNETVWIKYSTKWEKSYSLQGGEKETNFAPSRQYSTPRQMCLAFEKLKKNLILIFTIGVR